MFWIIILLIAAVFWLGSQLSSCRDKVKKYWDQLIVWRDWKREMDTWQKEYEKYFADHCTCDAPDPPDPPDAPTWPNGVEPAD